MRASIRAFLFLDALALAAAVAALLLALGLPLAARRSLTPPLFGAMAALAGLAVAILATAFLWRGVARPLERLFAAASRLGSGNGQAGLPIMEETEGFALSRAAVAFERLAVAFNEEREQLADKVRELTEANGALADARESLLRTDRLATVGRLAAGLAHEVGNPLGAITGYVELARTRLPVGADPELSGALDRIAVAAGRIDRAVRDLLDFARPAPPALAPIDLALAIDASLRLARVQARFKAVEVRLALAPDLPRVHGNERHLGQVLLNLFLNAADAMRGEGQVNVVGEVDGLWPDGAQRVKLVVADEGPGIAPEHLSRVFEPFFTTKEPGQGTGLGLAICQRIIESFDGQVAVGNAPGGGAIFTIHLRGCPATP
ncbi:MAG TPA: ATP-binding protein [Anaeromyxobacteraceae bacterium]|nr:ATP-binding protein [Anaeromyxobacteraceae bacterium]